MGLFFKEKESLEGQSMQTKQQVRKLEEFLENNEEAKFREMGDAIGVSSNEKIRELLKFTKNG